MTSPNVVSRAEWLKARTELLEREKQHTKAYDEILKARRDLPMVKIEKDYRFHGAQGEELTLLDLFEGRQQLVVRHVMFAPGETEGCIGCSMQIDSIGELAHINARDTTLVLVHRAPLADSLSFRERMGWMHLPFYSSFGSDFNYDFEVSTDKGESPGVSSFFREGDDVFHTYSVYDRGGEIFKNFYNYVDTTHLGRREDELEHPWDWWRHKDRYEAQDAAGPGANWWNGTRFKQQ